MVGNPVDAETDRGVKMQLKGCPETCQNFTKQPQQHPLPGQVSPFQKLYIRFAECTITQCFLNRDMPLHVKHNLTAQNLT